MSNCPSCGGLTTPGALYCRTCGVGASATVAAPTLPRADDVSTSRTPARTALIVVVAIIALLFWSYAKEERRKEAEAVTVSMGAPIVAGGLAWTGIEAHTGTVLKSDNEFMEELVTRGQYVVVDVLVENVGAESESPGGYSLTDGQGRKYESMWAYLYVPDSHQLRELNPGLSQTGRVIFETPNDASGFVFRVRGATAGIDLGF